MKLKKIKKIFFTIIAFIICLMLSQNNQVKANIDDFGAVYTPNVTTFRVSSTNASKITVVVEDLEEKVLTNIIDVYEKIDFTNTLH